MSAIEVVAGLSVLAGAALQSAVGFGFALVCAPLLFAATTPEHAIGLLLLLAVEVNLLTLAGERRRPHPLGRDIAALLAWSLPGMVVGLLVLRSADSTVLQVIVTVAVFVSLAVQRWVVPRAAEHAGVRPAAWWAPPAAGLAAGALTTSTSTSGPPVVLFLLGRGASPGRVRDSLTLAFLGLAILGAAVLTAGGVGGAVPEAAAVAALVPLVVVGHVAGRPVFARLAAGHYEAVLTVVLSASALGGLAVAVV